MVARIEIGISRDETGTFHLQGESFGDSKQECLDLVEFVTKVFTEGRTTFMRVNPEADTWTDFDTKKTTHKGYVRFSFRDEPGITHRHREVVTIPFGALR